MLLLALALLVLLLIWFMLLLLLWRFAPAILKLMALVCYLRGQSDCYCCYLPPPLLEGIADEEEPKYVALDGRDVAMPLLLPLPLARVVSTAPGAELK